MAGMQYLMAKTYFFKYWHSRLPSPSPLIHQHNCLGLVSYVYQSNVYHYPDIFMLNPAQFVYN